MLAVLVIGRSTGLGTTVTGPGSSRAAPAATVTVTGFKVVSDSILCELLVSFKFLIILAVPDGDAGNSVSTQ